MSAQPNSADAAFIRQLERWLNPWMTDKEFEEFQANKGKLPQGPQGPPQHPTDEPDRARQREILASIIEAPGARNPLRFTRWDARDLAQAAKTLAKVQEQVIEVEVEP